MIRKLLPLLCVALVCVVGCGKKIHKVEVEVTKDGKPVEGAAVTFIPAGEGGANAAGTTNSKGIATLTTTTGGKGGVKEGVAPGDYKVVIVKFPRDPDASSGPPPKPGTDEYVKMMQKRSEQSKKGPAGAPKSELPAKYATAKDTPLTAKVPSDSYKFDVK